MCNNLCVTFLSLSTVDELTERTKVTNDCTGSPNNFKQLLLFSRLTEFCLELLEFTQRDLILKI